MISSMKDTLESSHKKLLFFTLLLVSALTITLLHSNLTLNILGATTDEYDQLRLKWRQHITGGNNYNPADPDIATKISSIDASANSYWNSMNKATNRSSLWSDLASTNNSSHITRAYERLHAMSLAYSTHGSTLENNQQLRADLISAMDWMYTNRYNERKKSYDNWWDWELGTPIQLNDIVVMLYDQLSATQRTNYMNAVNKFSPTVTMTGYNRAAKGWVIAGRGIIVKSAAKITEARNGVGSVFAYVTTGDGFYTDGSFIQHEKHSYNGGYGFSTLQQLSKLLYTLEGSTWTITDPNKNNIYSWIYNSFEPLIYKGAMMDMTRGRMISYSHQQDHEVAGARVIPSIITIAQIAPPEDAVRYKSMIKHWVISDTYRNFLTSSPMYFIVQAKSIIADPAIPDRGELALYKQYHNMDRAVHLQQGFGFGISMSSNRTYNYESINNNNLKGWYTGDGMTFLYNNDLSQFSNDFWPTINPYRLPGITVDTMTRSNSSGARYLSTKNWVGGVNFLNRFGVTGMDYDAYGSSLVAKKSWFMFDNEVVALGSGITNNDNRTIETIVENRKLSNNGTENLSVNGVLKPNTLGWSETMTGVNWINLEGTAGYYFPTASTIKGLREARTGRWTDINTYGDQPSDPITRNYLTMWFDHGINPSNRSYAYTILPNMDPVQTATYATTPDISIVSNTPNIHAVQENTLNILGANFWQAGTAGYITSSNPASVMAKTDGETFKVAVSDPTQSQSTLNLEFAQSATSVINKDAAITVLQLSPVIKIQVNTTGSKGKTFSVTFSQVAPSPTPTPTPTDIPTPTPTTDPNLSPTPTQSVPTATPTATPTPVPVVTTFTPVADAYVRDGTYANTNFGTTTTLTTKNDASSGYTRHSYLRFDLSTYNGTVSNAKLRLYPSTVGTSGITNALASVANITWGETAITWNTKPVAGSIIRTWTPTLGNWIEIDITTQIQNALAGTKQVGFLIYSTVNVGSAGNVNYDSREVSTTAPQVVITQ